MPKRTPGRPTALNATRHAKVVEATRLGNYRDVSARAAGVGTTTFYRWLERGEADVENGQDTIYSRLWEDVKQAEADAETSAVGKIREAAKADWRADAWFLERRHHERWGRRDRQTIEASVTADVEVIHNKVVEVMPDEDRRLEVAKILAEAVGGAEANGGSNGRH